MNAMPCRLMVLRGRVLMCECYALLVGKILCQVCGVIVLRWDVVVGFQDYCDGMW